MSIWRTRADPRRKWTRTEAESSRWAFQEKAAGNIEPRTVMILVEWASREAFDSYRDDPLLADLHPHRADTKMTATALIRFLASPEAAAMIAKAGLTPINQQ